MSLLLEKKYIDELRNIIENQKFFKEKEKFFMFVNFYDFVEGLDNGIFNNIKHFPSCVSTLKIFDKIQLEEILNKCALERIVLIHGDTIPFVTLLEQIEKYPELRQMLYHNEYKLKNKG